jgi:translation initiation factor 1
MAGNLGDLLKAAGLRASEAAEVPPAPTAPVAAEETRFAAKVVVRHTRKGRGGRTVTTVAGVEAGREAIAAALKRAMGTGARVEGDEIVVQGELVERVAAWLEAQGARRVVRG